MTNEEILGLRAGPLANARAAKVGAPVAPNRRRRVKSRLISDPVALLTEHSQDGSPPPSTTWFHYFEPAAREVFLAGDFNRWDPTATPMFLGASGEWCAEFPLQPGAHEYRLVVDGVWKEDPHAAESRPNPFGGRNSVRRVSAL